MQEKDEVFQLADKVRETSFQLHSYLRHGHLEKIDENGLASRLRKAGVSLETQHPLQVFDEDGTVLGDYKVDMLVEGHLIVEIKACQTLTDDHTAQLLGYLRASRKEHGLLINFGSPRLQIRKFVFSDPH